MSNPVVLYLGTWNRELKSGKTKKFWCGIDMNRLDYEQLASLQQSLPEILKTKNLKARYWKGKELVPDIFVPYYRTYFVGNVGSVIKGRLFSLDVTDADKEEAARAASKEGEDYDELSLDIKNYHLAQAVRKRGAKEVEEQEKSAKEKDERPEEMAKPKDKGHLSTKEFMEPPSPPSKGHLSAKEFMKPPQPKGHLSTKEFMPIRAFPKAQQASNIQATKHSMMQPDPSRLRQEKPKAKDDES
jgi:hypothetical protein